MVHSVGRAIENFDVIVMVFSRDLGEAKQVLVGYCNGMCMLVVIGRLNIGSVTTRWPTTLT